MENADKQILSKTPESQIPGNIMIKSIFNLYNHRYSYQPYIYETIQEIYNYIYSGKEINIENFEIEAKLGKFNFRGNYIHCYNYIKEIFKIPAFDYRDSNYKYDFVSGLEQNKFFAIWYFVDKESQNTRSEIDKLIPETYKEIIYQSGKRKSSLYRDKKYIREDVIKKEDKVHFNIRNNGNDFRITVCKEMNNEIIDEDIPTKKRDKFRISYEFRFFRIDFTIVNMSNIDGSMSEISYEIECEVLSKKLKEMNDYFRSFQNFQYVFNRFFQNIFCFYCLADQDYLMDKFSTEKDKFFGNIFGNYLEKNFDKKKLID